jgi:mRNA (guanine-N7-)-methyltransferase
MWNVKDHYDARAEESPDRAEALRRRAMGPSAPIKRYHNSVKRKLIQTFAKNVPRLLDIACGRGGDISKWNAAGVGHVTGIDISSKEVEEARSRYENFKSPTTATTCTFEIGSGTTWRGPEKYDVVTCMFAIHYFFDSEKTVDDFFKTVSHHLKPEGYFIGTFPNAHRVLELSKAGIKNHPWIRIESLGQTSYRCTLRDTIVDGEGSVEYLVYPEILERTANAHGLVLFKNFKDFQPPYPPPMADASTLYSSFVFRKVSF